MAKRPCVTHMTRIRGFLTFYHSFFLYPSIILTLCGCYLFYKNNQYHYGITSSIVMMKIITTAIMAYLAYGKKELYCYYNLGLSYRLLIVLAAITDLSCFAFAFKLTKSLL
jgi:hypothetical protein